MTDQKTEPESKPEATPESKPAESGERKVPESALTKQAEDFRAENAKLAKQLADDGHTGFCCATPREVEGMVAAGLGDDLLLANESLDVARLVHKDIARDLKFARMWGMEVFDGQQVGPDHLVSDGDVVELHL